MKKQKKHLLILFCGGTIAMRKSEKTGALEVADTRKQVMALEPRLQEYATITVRPVVNIDSSNMTHREWERLAEEVRASYTRYDGFVVTMGTNTMAYASSALSFALGGIGKPVVFTGAQIPAGMFATDARNNLINAVRVAAMDLGGVFVVFGSKVILGCRAKKMSESDLDAFGTFNDQDFGRVAIGIKINKSSHRAHRRALCVINGFDDNVVCLTLVPGLKGSYLTSLIDSGIKGMILRAYGSGDVPYNLLESLQYAHKKKVPVVVTTQCPGGATVMGLNDVGWQALETGVIQAFDMSMEAMSTKLMWLIFQGVPYAQMKKRMHANVAGELNPVNAEVFLDRKAR